MVIEYGIEIDGDSGSYIIETNNERIVKEKLEFKIEQKRGYYFELLENEKIRLNNRIFKKQEYLNELKSNINRYWGKHSLLSIISNDMNNSIKGYVEKSISKNFLKILHMFNKMNCVVKEGTSLERGKLTTNKEMILNLQSGTIDLNKVKELDDTEEFLDNLLTNLYADIKNVYYKRSIVDDEINYELIIQKLIGNELLDINASMESTGTLSILKLLPAICMAISGSISIIDEFETGIHDVLVKDILKEINNNISGQIILTTHNTLILEQEEFKKYIYFIVVDSYGNKNVCSISDYDQRTQRNHNIRDLYLRGFYEGVPYIGNFDLSVVEDYFE